MRATGGQNHRDSVSRKNRTGINVTTVRAHQSIHVPVTVINVRNTVQNVIAGRGIVLIGAVTTALVVVTGARVSITCFVRIVPGTSISIHCIVTDTHTVALIQECLDSIIGFTGKVRFLVNADAPADRVNSIVSFSIHHITVGVLVKLLSFNRQDRDMLTHMAAIIILQPTVIGNIVDKVCIHTACVRNPGIQEHNRILIFRARSTSTIAAIVAEDSCVSGNIDRSASQIPIVTVVVWTEINGLTIPFRVDFEHIAIR